MTFTEITVDTSFAWHTTSIPLSGTTYTLRFRFNTRSNRWEMDVADASDNDILDGIPMLIDTDLTYQYKTALGSLPVGTFFILDNTNQGMQPTQYSFGTTHSLIYADPTV